MKYRYIGLLIMVVNSLLFCHKKAPQLEYYKYIYSAEKSILNKKLRDAYVLYKKALNLNCTYFAKDYYNFIKIGCSLNKNVESSIIELLKLGISINYLRKDSCINILLDSLLRKNDFIDLTRRAIETYHLKINTEYRNQLDSLFALDQKWRIADLEDGHGYDNFKDKIDSTNKIVGQKFLDLVGQNGFPSEKLLGFQDSFPFPLYYNYYFPLIHQNYSNRTITLTHLIEDATLKGEIHPEVAAMILDYHNLKSVYGLMPSPIFKVLMVSEDFRVRDRPDEFARLFENAPLYLTKISDGTINSYNKSRSAIGIPSFNEFSDLLSLRSGTNGFKFYYNEMSVYFPSDTFTYNSMIKNAIKIENIYSIK